MKSRTLFAAICLLLAHFALAQDFTFSQYAAMPYLINPATTGQVPTFTPLNQNVEHNYQHRVALLARNHWSVPGSVNGLSAAAAGWDMRFCNGQGDNYFFGLGAYMQGDYAGLGDYFNLNMRGMASFAHQLAGDAWLSYGLSAGWLQYGVQPHELTFDGQFNPVSGYFDLKNPSGDPALGEGRLSNGDWDMDFGIRAFGTRTGWHAGFTLHHFLSNPVYSFAQGSQSVPNRLGTGFSLQFATPALRGFALTGLLRRQAFSESRQWQLTAGPMCRFEGGQVGLLIRASGRQQGLGLMTRDALIPFVGVHLYGWALRASWDINLSRLQTGAGGPELSVGLFFGNGRKCVRCPAW